MSYLNDWWRVFFGGMEYPYTDSCKYNDDWLLEVVKKLVEEFANFVNLNKIKYANPIGWDITRQYEVNTVVVDNRTGDAYISVKPVPRGVQINNTEYWTQIYNYANVVDTLRAQIAFNEGMTTTATRPYAVGDLVFVSGLLYEIIQPMIAGDTFVANSNCRRTTIDAVIKAEKAARTAADSSLNTRISDEVSDREAAVNDLQAQLNTEVTTRGFADNYIKSFLPLNDSIIIVGDSYMVGVGATMQTGLGYKIAEACDKTINDDAFIMAQSACGFVTSGQLPSFETIMRNHESDVPYPNNVSAVIIVGGTNDALRGTDLSSVGTAITSICDYIKDRYPKAHIFMASNIVCAGEGMALNVTGYLNIFKTTHDFKYIGDLGNYLKKLWLFNGDTMNDTIHPNAKGYELAGYEIAKWILGIPSTYEAINAPIITGIDMRLNTSGNRFNIESLTTTIFGTAMFNFTALNNTPLNKQLIAKSINALKISNVWNNIPWIIGSSFGLVESILRDMRAFYPCILEFQVDSTGHIEVYATATIDDQFIYSDNINAFWTNIKLSGDLCYTKLNV